MNTDDERFQEIVRQIRTGDPRTIEAVKDELSKLTLPARQPPTFPEPGKDWYAIRVELVSGRGQVLDPPPGRDFLISPQHTFRQFAEAINAGFARWDLGHLYVFRLGDGTMAGTPAEDLSFKDAPGPRLPSEWRARRSSTNSTSGTRGSTAAWCSRSTSSPRTSMGCGRRAQSRCGGGVPSQTSTGDRRPMGRATPTHHRPVLKLPGRPSPRFRYLISGWSSCRASLRTCSNACQ